MRPLNEYRAGELDFRAAGNGLGVVSGVIVRYGDVARFPWGTEEIRAGAFGDVVNLDLIANRMHQRHQPLARSGAGLRIIDDQEAMRAEVTLPDTSIGRDTAAEVAAKLLRGLSLEFKALKDTVDDKQHRVISEARMYGFGVVDRPAYPQSVAVMKRWDDYFYEVEKRDSLGAGLYLPLEYILREDPPEEEEEVEEEQPDEVVRFMVV